MLINSKKELILLKEGKRVRDTIRDKIDIIKIILNIYTQAFWKIPEDKSDIKIDIDYQNKNNRIYLYEEPEIRIQTFHTPFVINEVNEEKYIFLENTTIFHKSIDDGLLSVLKTIFNNIESNDWRFEDFILITYEVFKDQLNEELNNDYWNLIVYLMTFEPGYFRYDYDKEFENEKIHPLNHFDINYDKNATYKIGLHKGFTIPMIKDMINKTTDSRFLEEDIL